MTRKVLVGMLLLGALMIFALATFYIQDWQYYLRVHKGYQVAARFESAQDLREGDDVRLAGVEVGRVRALKIDSKTDPRRPVHAVLWIEENVQLRREDLVSIEIRSVFGGSYVVITPGDPSAAALKYGEELQKTKVGASLTQLVNRTDILLAEASSSMTNAREALESVRNIARKIEQGEGALGKLLTDEAAYTELRESLAASRKAFEGLEQIAKDIKEGKGVLGKLASDEQLGKDFEELIKNANSTMATLTSGIEKGDSAVGLLLKDKEFAQKIGQIATDMSAFSKTLSKVTENFDQSTLGKLVTSDEAYKSLTATLEEMRKGVSQLSEGEGTIGKLAKDDKVYKQISSALDSVQKLLDDYREQSPILTFFGAIFGAF